ncbi:MAG: diguanylate cyclase, partial [Lacisediminimonas sp.]|nr:diguanylate cyclase [Lacisediminimonas sp.]
SSNWNTSSSFVGKNYSFRPYFQEAMQGQPGKFYGQGMVSHVPGYYISYPVIENGLPVGAIVVKTSLISLDKKWQTDLGYEVAVADEHGIYFLSSNPAWKYRPSLALTMRQMTQIGAARQYEEMLQPLSILVRRELDAGTQWITVIDHADGAAEPETSYVVHSQPLSGSAWTVKVFMRTEGVRQQAVAFTVFTAFALAALLLVFMYWRELRHRLAEREAARVEIENAHAELALRHAELHSMHEALNQKAITDPVVGCFNRTFFLEQASRLAASALRHDVPLSLIVLDIDHFKHINDTYGHPTGDAVLRRLVEICMPVMREADLFARFGGEEFIVAMMHTNAREAMTAAERLRLIIEREPFHHESDQIAVTSSFGVAQFDPEEGTLDDAIRRADNALYVAKRGGRNRVALAPDNRAAEVTST